MGKTFKRCPTAETTYINKLIKEVREDTVESDRVLLDVLTRINNSKGKKK